MMSLCVRGYGTVRCGGLSRLCFRSYVLATGEDLPSEKLYVSKSLLRLCNKAIREDDSRGLRNTLTNYLKMCASSMVAEKPEERVKLAETILDLCIKNGVPAETSMYNQLINIYNFNNYFFSPSEFLDLMATKNCAPNSNTYNHMVKAYCNQGNIREALKLAEEMKVKNNLPIPESVYASLITGYSRAARLSDAEGVLDTMKSDGVEVGTATYTSLLCAYAERGQMDKIKETYDSMRQEGISPTSQSSVAVMDTLSMFGHGQLVANVLSLLAEEHCHLFDLYFLGYSCLSRGELEAPLLLLQHLQAENNLSELFISRFITASVSQGNSVSTILQQLSGQIDCEAFPHIPHILTSEVLLSAIPTQYKDCFKSYPYKGGLQSHPWGNKRWVSEVLCALNFLSTSRRLQMFHYYPLLARHCSDANLRGAVEAIYSIFYHKIRLTLKTSYRDEYIQQTFINAGVTMEDFIDTQVDQTQEDQFWLTQLVVFQLACCKVSSLPSTLSKIVNKQELWSDEAVLNIIPQIGSLLKKKEAVAIATALLMNEAPVKHVFDVLKYHGTVQLDLLEDIVDWILSLIEQEKATSSVSFFIEALMKNVNRLLPSKKLVELFNKLPPEMKSEFILRCHYVVHLIQCKMFEEALAEFQSLLSMNRDREIPVTTWSKIVVAACSHDPTLGDDLFEKMKAADYEADKHMQKKMLYAWVNHHKDVNRAEKVLEDMVFNRKEGYQMILPLWAQLGMLDKISRAEVLDVEKSNVIRQAKMVALVANQQYDKALELVESFSSFRSNYLSMLVELFLQHNVPEEKWTPALLQCGEVKFNTILLFAYIDQGCREKAVSLVKNISKLFQPQVQQRLSSPQGKVYEEFFKEIGISMETSSLFRAKKWDSLTTRKTVSQARSGAYGDERNMPMEKVLQLQSDLKSSLHAEHEMPEESTATHDNSQLTAEDNSEELSDRDEPVLSHGEEEMTVTGSSTK